MTMTEWVKLWEVISLGGEPKIPAQLHIHGQFNTLIDAFGSITAVYEYFATVERAEPADLGND